MFIQLENLTAVNPDRIILVPANREPDGGVHSFEILTEAFQRIATVTPREAEVFILLTAKAAEVLPEHPFLRTREWSVIDGKLNYRYARVLMESTLSSTGGLLEEMLKARVEACVNDKDADGRVGVMAMLRRLEADKEYVLQNRSRLRSLLLSNIGSKAILETILKEWDDIFVDLPF